jgi:hypothetical protein
MSVYKHLQSLNEPATTTIVYRNGGRSIYKNSKYPCRVIYADGCSIELYSVWGLPNEGYVFNIRTGFFHRTWNTLIKWFLLLFVIVPSQVRLSDLLYKMIDAINSNDEDIQ